LRPTRLSCDNRLWGSPVIDVHAVVLSRRNNQQTQQPPEIPVNQGLTRAVSLFECNIGEPVSRVHRASRKKRSFFYVSNSARILHLRRLVDLSVAPAVENPLKLISRASRR
jgi:hypothetical protein